MTLSRRRFLALGSVAGIGVAAGCTGGGVSPAPPPPELSTIPAIEFGPVTGIAPFGLGVASGDPDPTSVVLWTFVDRDAATEVIAEVAADEAFTAIVGRWRGTADVDRGHTVRIVADGLAPDTVYWYRFAADGYVTDPARTRTAPSADTTPASLRVGHLSCQRYSSGYWTTLADVAEQAPDVIVHCGDYVYEAETGGVRPVDVAPPTDLAGYRALWRRYKAEPELQAAHAVAPWLMVWDDHEVENNYQGTDPGDPPEGAAFLAQRAAAYRAWWEFTPNRLPPPDGPDLGIHRVVDWGGLTRFVLLDTRQYRDDQPCPGDLATDVGPRCAASDQVSMLGDAQEAWFDDVAGDHTAAWTTVIQQVVVHQWRLLPGNALWNLDQWDGYPEARRRFLETLSRSPVPVVLTGDVHSSWVADLTMDFENRDAAAVGVEFVAPGVSSDVPATLRQTGRLVESQSPHIAWSETTKRGWVLHEITAEAWQAEYRLVDDATDPASQVRSARTWTVDREERRVR